MSTLEKTTPEKTTPLHCEQPVACASRPTDSVDVSIIVPTFNRGHWLGEALETLARQETGDGLAYEIIVVDNNSTDDTARVAKEFAKHSPVPFTYVLEKARGDAQARNRGIAEARGQRIAFFDDDQFAPTRWLIELVRCADMTGAEIVGGPVLLAIDDDRREALGDICRQHLREIDLSDNIIEYRGKQLPGTGNALVDRNVLDRLDNFSLAFPSGGSDSDFFLRARAAGMKLIYSPKASIRHRVDENRLTPAYLRWQALVSGAEHCARFDIETGGTPRLVAMCFARLGQAALINGPLWLKAKLTGNSGEAFGRRTLLWRCEGYTRKTLAVLCPKLFKQSHFFAWLDMQTGRDITGR